MILLLLIVVTSWTAEAGDDKPMMFEMGGLKARVPAAWKLDATMREFRLATWSVPGDDGEVEVYVAELPADSLKQLKENIKRWQSRYKLPAGKKDFEEITRISNVKVGEVMVTMVDIEGIPTGKKDFLERRINAIFPTKDATYYLVMRGPARLVAANKQSFENWLQSFK